VTTPVVVTVSHLRLSRMCCRGARAWFIEHGLDWTKFVNEGLPAEQFEATGDAMALKLVEVARGRR
jgi:hypothetical protein